VSINKVCVVGAGYWGKNHVRTLDKLKALGGIVETDKKIQKDLTEKYPNIIIFNNLDDALIIDKFKGFTVATPAETHYHITKKIILSGKHVLVEKPIALNIENAKELSILAKQKNVNLMVGHLLLFHPAIIKIHEIIKNGKIGKLQYIYSNRLNLGQVRLEENVFWSLAPHDISIFQYLTNSYPKEVFAKGSCFLRKGIYDSTVTLLKYKNGVEGHIFVSWLHPFKEHRLVVIGSEAMISFDDSIEDKPLKLYSKKFKMSEGIPKKFDGPVKNLSYKRKMPLTEELKYFVNHLNGDEINISNGKHAIDVTKILVQASEQLLSKV